MRVAIAGGTGMIGTWLARTLRDRGDEVWILTRRRPRAENHVQWEPARGYSSLGRLDGIDAVVNLAGAPIASRPWTRARRRVLWESRVDYTRNLLDALGQLSSPPRVFVGAGGLGVFGDRGDDLLDDTAVPGEGFLADLAVAWEEAHHEATRLGCRTATLRMSIVLAPDGGAFPLMVRPFQLGLGGWLGNGQQYTCWMSVRDAVGAFVHLLDHDGISGGVNGTVPEPCRNKDWFRALGRALNRPVRTHAPKWALRGALGELADDLFLASVRAVPRKLLDSGYTFRDPHAEPTFRWLVGELGAPA